MTYYMKNCNARHAPQPHPAYRGVTVDKCKCRSSQSAEILGEAVDKSSPCQLLPLVHNGTGTNLPRGGADTMY